MKQLIDDSFKRSLDLGHYLARIKDKIAKIIVIGVYEGPAIITSETSGKTGKTYSYLDKFAIVRSRKGSHGVADINFQCDAARVQG